MIKLIKDEMTMATYSYKTEWKTSDLGNGEFLDGLILTELTMI